MLSDVEFWTCATSWTNERVLNALTLSIGIRVCNKPNNKICLSTTYNIKLQIYIQQSVRFNYFWESLFQIYSLASCFMCNIWFIITKICVNLAPKVILYFFLLISIYIFHLYSRHPRIAFSLLLSSPLPER